MTPSVVDPLAGSAWSTPDTVAGFVASPPNAMLMHVAGEELSRVRRRQIVDIGCGAGRNAVPLAAQGWHVLGLDMSMPMLQAAGERAVHERDVVARLRLALAPMNRLPVAGRSCELVVAHGIWNLARSATEFREAVREAARVAVPGAALFVFTFSRHTLPANAEPVAGEPFVFTQFSGEPQCFLTDEQLVAELHAAGFVLDATIPLRELNRPAPGSLPTRGAPVIYEGVFRRLND
jgi:SAM-dependent methyltransferase